jgi:hypothetical protein
LVATAGGSGDSNEVIAGPAQPASNRANGVKNKFANRAGLAGRLLSMDEKLAAFAGYWKLIVIERPSTESILAVVRGRAWKGQVPPCPNLF